MLLLTPHTIYIESVSANRSAGNLNESLKYAAPVAVRGQMSATDPLGVNNNWGVEVTRPYRLLLNIDDVDLTGLKLGDKVVWNSRTFFVKAAPKRSEQGLGLDHATAIVDEFI